MNRGRRRETIYTDKHDYIVFIDLLRDASEMFNVSIAAYCLMPNHYHLLMQTPDAKSFTVHEAYKWRLYSKIQSAARP